MVIFCVHSQYPKSHASVHTFAPKYSKYLNAESDHRSYPDDELLDPASAQRTASSLLGIHNSRLQVNMHSDGSGGSGGGGGSRQYSGD